MPELNDNPESRIGEEWYDEENDEIFTIVGVKDGEKYQCEFSDNAMASFKVDYFEDERAYRFKDPQAAWD